MTKAITCVLVLLGLVGSTFGQCRYEITLIPDIPCQFGTSMSFAGLNDSGLAAGSRGECVFGSVAHPVVWTEEDGTNLVEFDAEIIRAYGHDVSNDGIVVGTVDFADDGLTDYLGFYVEDGEVHIIEPPTGMNTTLAHGINSSNHIAGQWGNNLTGPMRSCIWIDGVLIDLPDIPDGSQANDINELIEPPRPDIHFSQARAINESGQIIARTIEGARNYLLTPIKRPVADLDGDCRTCASDLVIAFSACNTVDSMADVTGDGVVDLDDLIMLISEWTADGL